MHSRRRVARALFAATALLAALVPAAQAYETATLLFNFQDPRITESSGFASSSRHPELWFTHNDSGDTARFFAVDSQGCTLATFSPIGADAVDWEDMARGPDEGGHQSLFFGDIGDNLHQRAGISVYRVEEPEVNASGVRESGQCPTGVEKEIASTRFDLAYPDTPHDAETLLVHPKSGQLFVVTKTYAEESTVYAAPMPLRPSPAVNVLEPVATIVFPPSSSHIPNNPPFGATGRLNATGGDIAPDASRVAIRTYVDAWEWTVPPCDFAKAFSGEPRRVELPPTNQGEAIAYTSDATSLVISTEGANAPVHLLSGS